MRQERIVARILDRNVRRRTISRDCEYFMNFGKITLTLKLGEVIISPKIDFELEK
jgi:hypothetical protein